MSTFGDIVFLVFLLVMMLAGILLAVFIRRIINWNRKWASETDKFHDKIFPNQDFPVRISRIVPPDKEQLATAVGVWWGRVFGILLALGAAGGLFLVILSALQ